jgi:hypothetical protein
MVYITPNNETNKNESKNMKKKNTIRLTESNLKRVIFESVKKVLNEINLNVESIVKSLSIDEYDFLCLSIDEGNLVKRDGKEGIDIKRAINSWYECVTNNDGSELPDGVELVNSLSEKGVGTINGNILMLNDGIIDVIDIESNYWMTYGFKPIRRNGMH